MGFNIGQYCFKTIISQIRIITLFCVLCFASLISYSQTPFNFGSTLADFGYGIAIDASNNVLTTGYFQGTVDFDPSAGTTNFTSVGARDIYIAKYSSPGVYQWAFNIGGTSTDIGLGITTDASNNVYVTGYFNGTADFDPSGATVNLTSFGSNDIFIAKYNSSGAYQWAFNIGSTSADVGNAITIDASGNILVTGSFNGTADFDPSAGTANLTSVGGSDMFIAKYNSAGVYQLAYNIESSTSILGSAIDTDASDNVFVTGTLNGTADFDPSGTTVNIASAGGPDVFVAKYNSSGTYQWAAAYGSTVAAAAENGYGLVVDASGNVVITGYFQGTVDFDPSAGAATLTNNGGGGSNADVYVAKYNSAGTYQWAFNIGNTTGSTDFGYGVTADASDNVFVTGYFYGITDFDPSGGTANLTSAGNNDIFIAKYNSAGAYICAIGMGGASSQDVGYAIALNSNNDAYITGTFQGTPDFDPSASTVNLTSAGSTDIFVARYDINCNILLPIDLLSFTAAPVKESNNDYVVHCDWITLSEKNNDYFTLERAISSGLPEQEELKWEEMGKIKGAGDSYTEKKYTFLSPYHEEEENSENILYYRLKQIDFNGIISYSDIIAVFVQTFQTIKLFPNPAINEVVVKIGADESTNAKIEVINALGQKVIYEEREVNKGLAQININVSQLPAGSYMFRVILPTQEKIQKMFIK